MASPHAIDMAHFNAIVRTDSRLDVIKGIWSRKIPALLPEAIKANPYPALICNFMTPAPDGQAMNDSPDIDPYSSSIWINEVHSVVSLQEAEDLTELVMILLNESVGQYNIFNEVTEEEEYGEVQACVTRSMWPNRVDERRGGAPVYIIGYKYETLTYRIIQS